MRVLKSGGLFACALLLGATAAYAQNPPGNPRPANAKAICKDGTYSTSTVRDQACFNHGGVKQWLRSDSLDTDTSRADTTHSRPSYPRPNCDTMLTGGYRCGPGDTLAPYNNRNNMNRPASRDTTTPVHANVQADLTTSTNSLGATAKCKDGLWSHSRNKATMCTNHGGVDQWID